MRAAARIRLDSIRRKRQKGDGPVTYRQRTKYLQIHADLTAHKAALLLEGGRSEAKLAKETGWEARHG